MSLTLLKAGIPGWTFNRKRDPSFQFLEEPHDYLFKEKRLWSPSMGFEQVGYVDPTYYTEESKYRGHYVHWATRLMDEDDLDWKDVSKEYFGYVEAYAEAKVKWRIRSRLVEKPIYHREYLYGVTPDREAIILDGDPAIVELKTGTMPWWCRFQTAAQADGVASWDSKEIFRRRIGLELRKNGTFRPYEFTQDDDDDYDTWRAILRTCQRIGQPPRKVARRIERYGGL